MHGIALDAEAGQVPAELAHRGVAAGTRARVLVEVVSGEADALLMAAIAQAGGVQAGGVQAGNAQAGGALDWLDDEPDLHTDTSVTHNRILQPAPRVLIASMGGVGADPT